MKFVRFPSCPARPHIRVLDVLRPCRSSARSALRAIVVTFRLLISSIVREPREPILNLVPYSFGNFFPLHRLLFLYRSGILSTPPTVRRVIRQPISPPPLPLWHSAASPTKRLLPLTIPPAAIPSPAATPGTSPAEPPGRPIIPLPRRRRWRRRARQTTPRFPHPGPPAHSRGARRRHIPTKLVRRHDGAADKVSRNELGIGQRHGAVVGLVFRDAFRGAGTRPSPAEYYAT